MKKLIKRLLWLLLLLVIIASSAFVFFTYTSTGFKSLVRFASVYFHQAIEIQNLQGRLRDHVQINELNYQYEQIHIKIKKAELAWTINSLWKQAFSL